MYSGNQALKHSSTNAQLCFSSLAIPFLNVKISLGDSKSYYLSTASNELGVINATSDAGVFFGYVFFFMCAFRCLLFQFWFVCEGFCFVCFLPKPIRYFLSSLLLKHKQQTPKMHVVGVPLIPISWCEMQCEKTAIKVKKKMFVDCVFCIWFFVFVYVFSPQLQTFLYFILVYSCWIPRHSHHSRMSWSWGVFPFFFGLMCL